MKGYFCVNKQEVEAITPGTISITLPESQLWGQVGMIFQEKLKKTIEEFCSEISYDFNTLRLIVVAQNFSEEVIVWEEKIYGYSGGISPWGQVQGKTLGWSSDESTKYHSMIILPEDIAVGLVTDESLSLGVLMHEMLHCYIDYLMFIKLGPDKVLKATDWVGIQRMLANSIWSEFFIELFTYRYMKIIPADEVFPFLSEILKESLKLITDAVHCYRIHGNLMDLWQYTINILSSLFAQMGRSIGRLIATQINEGEDRSREFFSLIHEVSPAWEIICRSLKEELIATLKTSSSLDELDFQFIGIEGVVEMGFEACGLFSEDGLEGL